MLPKSTMALMIKTPINFDVEAEIIKMKHTGFEPGPSVQETDALQLSHASWLTNSHPPFLYTTFQLLITI